MSELSSARMGRKINEPLINISQDFTTSQKIEWYDGTGHGFGELHELSHVTWRYPNDEPEVTSSDFLTVDGNAEGAEAGFMELPWVHFTNFVVLRFYTDVGGGRGYYVWRKEEGRVTPYVFNLGDLISNGAELVGGGMAAIIKNVVTAATLGSVSFGLHHLARQPVPMHHIGALKVTNRVYGTTLEPGSESGNRSTYANTDVTTTTMVMTEAFAEWMDGKTHWLEFLQLTSARRREDIDIMNRWERAREVLAANPDIRSPLDPRMAGLPRPDNPPPVHRWCIWAWKRYQQLDAPPSDPRRMAYPGYRIRNMFD